MRTCILLMTLCLGLAGEAQDMKKSIQTIGGLFRKKKNDSTSGSTVAVAAVAPAGAASGAGMPAANAKNIDADRLFSFNEGSALIRKGGSSALIDPAGNYIVPYNTIDMGATGPAGPVGYAVMYNGVYAFNNINANFGGYVNARGKIIVKTAVNMPGISFTDNKQLLEQNNSTHTASIWTYFDADGKAFTVHARVEKIVDGIGIVYATPVGPAGHRYMKLTGEWLPGAYDDASPFSDGLALVAKKDQFGELKYGYIDRQGRLAIPFSFSVKPSDFSGGYAKVQPKDRSAFEYAFINKSGEVVFKQTLADIVRFGIFDHFTNYGMAFSDKCVMDTSFRIVTKGQFFQSFGLPADSWPLDKGSYTEHERNPKLVFSTRTARDKYTSMPLYGFIDLVRKKVVMPVFDLGTTNGIWFDPVSHLALARVCTGRDNKNVPVYREGYINEDGQFVLIRGAGSTW